MADRYFYGHRRSLLQQTQPNLEETRIQRALRQLKPSEVTLHEIFLQPLTWHRSVAAEVDKITVVSNPKHSRNTPDYHLRRNILQMAHQTKDVQMLMTQFRWIGLLNMGHIRTIVQQGNDILRAITMYHIILKKEHQYFTKFVNGLLISRNGTVAHAVEYSADILELKQGILGKKFIDCDLHFSMRRGKFLPEHLRAIMYQQGEDAAKGLPIRPPTDLKIFGDETPKAEASTKNPGTSENTDITQTQENRACDKNQTVKSGSANASRNRSRSSGSRFQLVSRLFR